MNKPTFRVMWLALMLNVSLANNEDFYNRLMNDPLTTVNAEHVSGDGLHLYQIGDWPTLDEITKTMLVDLEDVRLPLALRRYKSQTHSFETVVNHEPVSFNLTDYSSRVSRWDSWSVHYTPNITTPCLRCFGTVSRHFSIDNADRWRIAPLLLKIQASDDDVKQLVETRSLLKAYESEHQVTKTDIVIPGNSIVKIITNVTLASGSVPFNMYFRFKNQDNPSRYLAMNANRGFLGTTKLPHDDILTFADRGVFNFDYVWSLSMGTKVMPYTCSCNSSIVTQCPSDDFRRSSKESCSKFGSWELHAFYLNLTPMQRNTQIEVEQGYFLNDSNKTQEYEVVLTEEVSKTTQLSYKESETKRKKEIVGEDILDGIKNTTGTKDTNTDKHSTSIKLKKKIFWEVEAEASYGYEKTLAAENSTAEETTFSRTVKKAFEDELTRLTELSVSETEGEKKTKSVKVRMFAEANSHTYISVQYIPIRGTFPFKSQYRMKCDGEDTPTLHAFDWQDIFQSRTWASDVRYSCINGRQVPVLEFRGFAKMQTGYNTRIVTCSRQFNDTQRKCKSQPLNNEEVLVFQ